jgi:hypothetical protein
MRLLFDSKDLRIQLSSILILIACGLTGCKQSHEAESSLLRALPIDKLISTETCKVHLSSEKIFVNGMDGPDKETDTFTLNFEFSGDSTVVVSPETQVCLTKRDQLYCKIYPGFINKVPYVKTKSLFLLMRADHVTPWGYVGLKGEKEAELVSVNDVVDWLAREKKIHLKIQSCEEGKQ